jgi:hypothetical protein
MGREKREKREGSKGNEGRRRTNAPQKKKKKLSSHGSILYIYKVTYFVYSKQNILITKKKKEV